jgi:uncharacterized FlaG/YvyC family protein
VTYNETSMAEFAEKNLLENMQKLEGPTAAAEAVLEEQEKQPVSKKEKKRQKLAAKQGGEGADKEEEKEENEIKQEVKDINELLFKPGKETVPFEVSELFLEPSISLSVAESPVPSVLSMTPKKLYQEIRKLAEKRYNYTNLPKKLVQLKSLENSKNKISLLRDICLTTGIVISFKQGQDLKDFIFENDSDKLKQIITENVTK